jgi:hypothetical protein
LEVRRVQGPELVVYGPWKGMPVYVYVAKHNVLLVGVRVLYTEDKLGDGSSAGVIHLDPSCSGFIIL